jgi:hypothetical protein
MPRDRLTADLFSWEPPKVVVGFEPDALPGNRIASKISRAVALALKACGKSRADVAAAMSAELGQTVSVDMLDAYASEAKEGHRISLERFLALVTATGCHDLLGFLAEPFGFVVVPERFASLIELHLVEEHERKVARHKATIEAKWRAGQ